mgnify:CR=1 FL=1
MEENMREALETLRAQMHRLVDERIDDAVARMESGEIDYEPVRAHPLDWRPAAFKGTKAVAVILPDGNEVEAKTWQAVVEIILKDCAADPVRRDRGWTVLREQVRYGTASARSGGKDPAAGWL